jgi:hypothetical protein
MSHITYNRDSFEAICSSNLVEHVTVTAIVVTSQNVFILNPVLMLLFLSQIEKHEFISNFGMDCQ